MLKINDLSFGYTSTKVIKDLDGEWEQGEIAGIVGLNGSGKTTLFQLIFGLLKPDEGYILFSGKKINKLVASFVPAENYFYSFISGYDYLSLFEKNRKAIDHWNQLFDLPLKQLVDNYSTGMKKKLAIAGALMIKTPLILLDEPFNGLDLESVHRLSLALNKLKDQGKTIFISSHNVDHLGKIATSMTFLFQGKILTKDVSPPFHQFNETVTNQLASKSKQLVEEVFRANNFRA